MATLFFKSYLCKYSWHNLSSHLTDTNSQEIIVLEISRFKILFTESCLNLIMRSLFFKSPTCKIFIQITLMETFIWNRSWILTQNLYSNHTYGNIYYGIGLEISNKIFIQITLMETFIMESVFKSHTKSSFKSRSWKHLLWNRSSSLTQNLHSNYLHGNISYGIGLLISHKSFIQISRMHTFIYRIFLEISRLKTLIFYPFGHWWNSQQ